MVATKGPFPVSPHTFFMKGGGGEEAAPVSECPCVCWESSLTLGFIPRSLFFFFFVKRLTFDQDQAEQS